MGPPAVKVPKYSTPSGASGHHEGSRSGCTLLKLADASSHPSGSRGPGSPPVRILLADGFCDPG